MCGDGRLRRAGRKAGYELVECARCGFAFAPAIDAAFMAKRYASGYHGPEEGAPQRGWIAGREVLAPALERLPDDRSLRCFDFGAGQSQLPERLRAGGHRVIAQDLVPPLRPHPDRLTGPLDELDLPERSFDLVYSFQVFEHLPDPAGTFGRLLRLARGGGLLLIHTDMETPERLAADRLGDWWYVAPPDHCAFYRHRTFEVALQHTPHRLVWCDPKSVVIRVGTGQ